MNQEKIGKFIKDKRLELKMTQKDLADKSGISDRAISKYENGRGVPDVSLLSDLSKVLDVTINDLLSGEVVKKEEYQQKFEENIMNTIDTKIKKENKILKLVLYCIFTLVFLLVMYVSIESIYMKSTINSYPLIQKNYSDDIHANDNMYFERTVYSYGFYVKYFYKSKNTDKPMVVSNNIDENDFEIIRKDFNLFNGQLFWSIP